MLKKFLLFSLLFFVLISCSSTKKTKVNSIICFGDSLTFGDGATDEQSYPYFLQQLTSIPVINKGVCGDTSQDGLKRLKTLGDIKDSIVIVEFGINDFLRQRTSQTKENIELIVEYLINKGAIVVLVSTEDHIAGDLFEMLESIAKEKNVLFIDGILNDIWSDRTKFYDYIHPNSDGYKVVAEKVYNNIKNLIE